VESLLLPKNIAAYIYTLCGIIENSPDLLGLCSCLLLPDAFLNLSFLNAA